jgi:16S rRNA (adenine1518-N6/adenine1519-N6)-dimethyltransferase
VRVLAGRFGVRPTKRLGQNFVVDANTVRRIVRIAELDPADTVIEVGPGLGSLTLGLLAAARRVIAVEIDPVLAAALRDTVAERRPALAGRLRVLNADALQLASADSDG